MRPLTLGLIFTLLFASLRAEIRPDDGPLGYKPVVDEIAALWLQKKLPEIEALAERYRSGKETFPDGAWKLELLYTNLGSMKKAVSEAAFKVRLTNVEWWGRQRPESLTARITLASLYTDYAWRARGSGFASTVTPEGWRLFGERLARARTILIEARSPKPEPVPDPEWYRVMMTVALGQSWPRADVEKLFSEAIAAHPTYFALYTSKAYYLAPMWHGAPGDWQKFAAEMRDAKGVELYARICWRRVYYFDGTDTPIFDSTGVVWADVQAGYESLLRRNPGSRWWQNCYARLAKDFGDRETAARLFREIGEDYYSSAWRSRAMFDEYRAAALSPAPANPIGANPVDAAGVRKL